jgi:hypothetical protein
MNFKKTVILLIILCLLTWIAYILNRQPKKTEKESALFPEYTIEKAAAIRVNGPANKFTLNKEGDQWTVVEEANLPADPELIKQALQTVTEIKKEGIVSQNPSKQEIFQVDPNNSLEVEIKGTGNKALAHFYIGKNGPDYMSTYVRKADSNDVLLYKGFHLRSRFDKTSDAWLDKFMVKFKIEDIDRLEFKRKDQSFSIKHEIDKWRLEKPEEYYIKEESIKEILTTLTALRAVKVQPLNPAQPLREFGLDDPNLTLGITAFLTDGTSQTILIGKLEKNTDQYFVKHSDRPVVYKVGKFSIDKINKPWKELKKEEEPPASTPQPLTPETPQPAQQAPSPKK